MCLPANINPPPPAQKKNEDNSAKTGQMYMYLILEKIVVDFMDMDM
jgi:hypothetical protein